MSARIREALAELQEAVLELLVRSSELEATQADFRPLRDHLCEGLDLPTTASLLDCTHRAHKWKATLKLSIANTERRNAKIEELKARVAEQDAQLEALRDQNQILESELHAHRGMKKTL